MEKIVYNDLGQPYLIRWELLKLFGYKIMLHAILLPDSDRHLHDHPWPFISIVLKGWYREQVRGRVIRRRALSFAFRKAKQSHKIVSVSRVPVLTLVITGRKCRDWGFCTKDGWVDHITYFRRKNG